jgi:type III secretory pathway component EscS
MRRLYYLTSDLESLAKVSDLLQQKGFGKWRVRVISKNNSGLYKSNLQSTQISQDNDMLHWGLLGVFVGGIIGLLVSFIFKLVDPFDIPIPWYVLIVISGVFTCFGAWSGGLFGIAHLNYKTYKFFKNVVAGNHVMMVDIPIKDKKIVCDLIKNNFDNIKKIGEDSTLVHPFDIKFWKFVIKKIK